MRRICIYLAMSFLCMVLPGCVNTNESTEKIRDLDFTVMSSQNIPQELLKVLEEEKTDVFHRTYSDGDKMYLCVGYGEQVSGGYSIMVNELCLTKENVCLDTTLIGPGPGENVGKEVSYPYIVICTEQIDLPVLFE